MVENKDQLTLGDLDRQIPRDEDRYFAGQLISQLQKDLAKKNRYIIGITTKWIVAYEYLKGREDYLYTTKNALQSEREHYFASITIMKGLGELLLMQLRQHEEVDLDKHLGYSYEDLEACVQELSATDYTHFWEPSNSRVEELKAAFCE